MTTEHAAPAEDPSFRTPCMVGALIGFVVFTIGCTWLGLAAGSNFAGALGLGLFAAAWGGAGFGAMAGGIYVVSRPGYGHTPVVPAAVAVPASQSALVGS